jgi:hypothetical protein
VKILPLLFLAIFATTTLVRADDPVTVSSPLYGSTISGTTPLRIHAPGLTSVTVKCWKQGGAFGADSTVGTVALDGDGNGTIAFPADDFPHGPITVRVSGAHWLTRDNCYLQLYNQGGVIWNQGLPARPPPEARGMSLVFADDFTQPLSISGTDTHATYFDHKPGGGDFGAFPFAGHADPNNPFSQIDSYLRIRADEATKSAGLISSVKWDDSGVKASVPCYFECRFLAPSAPGTWPAFWIMTDYMTDRLKGRDVPVDELDVVEEYGGEGPGQPAKSGDTSDASYRVTSHFWNQGAAGEAQPGIYKPVYLRRLGGGSSWWETFHTYGCKVTATDTIYYCDDVEVGRHPTGAVSKKYPFFFLIDLAIGGNGWPVDLSQSGGIADMYVDYVRVYSGAKAPASAAK